MTKPATVAKGAAPTGGKSKQANAKGKSKATATAHVKATATSTAQEPVPTADHLPLQESEAPHAAPTQQPLLLHALHFAQSLLHGGAKSTASTGGKHSSATLSLSTGDLLARLRTLHNELRQIGQENIDVGSLGMVTRELVASSLLHHKDNGVRSLVACCVVDLLRLYAPDAPYGEDELKVGHGLWRVCCGASWGLCR